MDNKTQERIKADAEAYVQRTRGQQGRVETYIAGATAENSRAKVLVDALEEIDRRIKIGKAGASYQIEMIRPVVIKALEQWKGKEVEPKPQQPDLGTCVECGTRKAVSDYNGHQYFVCDPCNNRLNREFDKEYN